MLLRLRSFALSLFILGTANSNLQVPVRADAQGRMSGAVSTAAGYRKSGEELLQMGNYKDAQKALLEAVKNIKGASAEEEATVHADLGEAYLWQGDFGNAGSEFNRALSLAGKSGTGTIEARVTNLQSWLLQGQGKQDKAVQYCQSAIQMWRKVGPESAGLADSLEHLGILFGSSGNVDGAQTAFEEALAIRRVTSGANSMDVANLMEQVGALMVKRGKTEQGQQMIGQALSLKEASEAALQPFTPHIADDSVVFHFVQGAPNCSRGFSQGNLIEGIIGNGINIQCAITQKPSEFAKSARAEISVVNNSNRTINLLSQPPSFIVIRPKIVIATQIAADDLANAIEKKGKQKAGWVRFWGDNATTTMTTTMIGGNGFYPGMGYGYMPTNFGYCPPMYNRGRGGSDMAIMTTSVPDFEARARAEAKAQQIANRSQADAAAARENALGPTSIPPGGSIQGSLDFDQVNFTEAILRVPVGNAIFEFHFNRDKDK